MEVFFKIEIHRHWRHLSPEKVPRNSTVVPQARPDHHKLSFIDDPPYSRTVGKDVLRPYQIPRCSCCTEICDQGLSNENVAFRAFIMVYNNTKVPKRSIEATNKFHNEDRRYPTFQKQSDSPYSPANLVTPVGPHTPITPATQGLTIRKSSRQGRKQNAMDTDVTTTTLDDTVHYMSPVSPLSGRTDYEGDQDLDYFQFLKPTMRQDESSTYKSSTISCLEPELQRTIAIVKPDAMVYEDVVVRAINEAGFSTIAKRYVHFTPEQVSEFYSQYYGSPAFPHQVVSMSVAPVLVLSLADINAVAKWRDLVGPDKVIRDEWFVPMSMRVRFGLQDNIQNGVHASENLHDANKENRYVYPKSILEPFICEHEKVNDYCGLYINPTLLDGLTALVKTKPIDPIMYLAEWLLRNNPFQPRFSKDINLLPT
ncbi:hypothetical protein Trydic_g6115 [Trypoxylus dichotomus]